ncbi:HAD family hydrolase [Streptomyces nitrosporeus]|uniref:HAD family hydrolase n=1 Tax=Streptomyces nitrosporeus TaxID=28894 RepID=UPI00142EFA7F|nr:HAD hydrolase family protein [Streptomyces nitrosporeus]GGZ18966.1 hydrolase [Streptomyces nitrosporeus]
MTTPPALPRLLAVDLDGTLLRSDFSVSPRTRRAVAAAQADGIETVFVTVRHAAAIEYIVEALGLSGEAVCCGGAGLWRIPSMELTEAYLIDTETARETAARVKRALPDARIGWMLPDRRVGYAPDYPEPLLIGESFRQDPAALDTPVLKLFAVSPRLREITTGEVEGFLGGLVDVSHHNSGVIDLVVPGVSKIVALEKLCAARGVTPAEVIAFGDARTDLEMIRWAGRGVFMGNAEPALHAEADLIAPSNDEDGVAAVLERLLADPSTVPVKVSR